MLCTKTFSLILILNFLSCVLGTEDKTTPLVYKLATFLIPSVVRRDDTPVSHTTNILASLVRERNIEGFPKNFKNVMTKAQIAKIPTLIQGFDDYFGLWMADVLEDKNNSPAYRVSKTVGDFDIPIYGGKESIGEVCLQHATFYYIGGYVIRYTWKFIGYLLSFTRYDMSHIAPPIKSPHRRRYFL